MLRSEVFTMNKCVRAVISGKVQGVYFRIFTQQEAEHLHLSGWVRNLPTGEVEALISGPSGQVDKMVEWLTMGSPSSRVDHVAVEEVTCAESLFGFSIRY
ncbi:MAG: acylphosphatase [Thermodesulfobacteriota bacterium]